MMKSWVPTKVDDDDEVFCMACGEPHQLVYGEVNGMSIGNGMLFYQCGEDYYVGAINKQTVFGVNPCNRN